MSQQVHAQPTITKASIAMSRLTVALKAATDTCVEWCKCGPTFVAVAFEVAVGDMPRLDTLLLGVGLQ